MTTPAASPLNRMAERTLTDYWNDSCAVEELQYAVERGAVGATSRRMGSARIVTGLRRDGSEFPIDASISQVQEDGRKFYTVILRDVTERVHSERALMQSRQDLRELAWSLEHATNLKGVTTQVVVGGAPRDLKIIDGVIYTQGRDQITRLKDLDGDGVADVYENFNNDVSITPNFHEFALDLPLDDPAVVAGLPLHGPNRWPAEHPWLRAAAEAAGLRGVFVPTGQTGMMIEGWGVAVDRVISDFLNGTCEWLVEEAEKLGDWIFIEGQGSVDHPAYSSVTLGLMSSKITTRDCLFVSSHVCIAGSRNTVQRIAYTNSRRPASGSATSGIQREPIANLFAAVTALG